MDSILQSTKKILGLDAAYDVFDIDVISHINSAFSFLNQLGIGPDEGFMIEDDTELWADFVESDPLVEDPSKLNLVKTYIYLKVSILFDPPTLGYLIDAKTNQIKEIEWRLQVLRESYQVEEVI